MKLVCREIVEIYIVEWLEKSREAATGLNEKVNVKDHVEKNTPSNNRGKLYSYSYSSEGGYFKKLKTKRKIS